MSPCVSRNSLSLGIGVYPASDEVTAGTSQVREYVVAGKNTK